MAASPFGFYMSADRPDSGPFGQAGRPRVLNRSPPRFVDPSDVCKCDTRGAMKKMSHGVLGGLALLALASAGCAGKPAAPFDTLKNSQLIALRLQNYEPPTPPPGAAAPQGGGLIPGLPPEIQSWIGQGAQGLQQLIPPGLLPPGMMQGAPAAPAAPPVD